jgi:hypothetical protein
VQNPSGKYRNPGILRGINKPIVIVHNETIIGQCFFAPKLIKTLFTMIKMNIKTGIKNRSPRKYLKSINSWRQPLKSATTQTSQGYQRQQDLVNAGQSCFLDDIPLESFDFL